MLSDVSQSLALSCYHFTDGLISIKNVVELSLLLMLMLPRDKFRKCSGIVSDCDCSDFRFNPHSRKRILSIFSITNTQSV